MRSQVAAPSTGELLELAHQLADAARSIALGHFRRNPAVERKSDATPVTVADRAIEARLREMIAARFPEHGLIGEEQAVERAQSRAKWVIDPIDGTKSFVTGMPTFGCLIAFLLDERPVLGVVEMPALGERWVAVAGAPTELNGAVCRSAATRDLAEASLFATSPFMFDEAELARFTALNARVAITRFGADCYAYGLLASGLADLVVEADMKPYDYLAHVPVIESAGGTITDWQGRALSLASGGRILAAANPSLHAAALAVLGAS